MCGVTVFSILIKGIIFRARTSVRGRSHKVDKATDILAESGVTYVNLVSFEGMAELLPQEAWPTTYFVDEKGVLIGETISDSIPDLYRDMIENLLTD